MKINISKALTDKINHCSDAASWQSGRLTHPVYDIPTATQEKHLHDGQPLGPSVLVNRNLGRYFWLLEQSMPNLSEHTWMLLLQAHNGCVQFDVQEVNWIASAVFDDQGIEQEQIEQALSNDKKTNPFSTCIRELLDIDTPIKRLAVSEVIERYWARKHNGDLREILSEITNHHPQTVFFDDPHPFIAQHDKEAVLEKLRETTDEVILQLALRGDDTGSNRATVALQRVSMVSEDYEFTTQCAVRRLVLDRANEKFYDHLKSRLHRGDWDYLDTADD